MTDEQQSIANEKQCMKVLRLQELQPDSWAHDGHQCAVYTSTGKFCRREPSRREILLSTGLSRHFAQGSAICETCYSGLVRVQLLDVPDLELVMMGPISHDGFVQLFEEVWNSLLPGDRQSLVSLWRGHKVPIGLLSGWIGWEGEVGQCAGEAEAIRFWWPILNEMPDRIVAEVIAHELLHAVCDARGIKGRSTIEDVVAGMERERGFPVDEGRAWLAEHSSLMWRLGHTHMKEGAWPANLGLVWANPRTGRCFESGSRWFGKTKEGEPMTVDAARARGYELGH
ncbi:MAG TPA: hypothetical protein VFJ58_15960 [Armatimonadota bacterium]|nr:hypothetical protein [Armatimonadota bacterium]